jgi:hypothetical protein
MGEWKMPNKGKNIKTIVISVSLLLIVSIFSGCGSSHPPYPSDELLITGYKNNKKLFLELISDPGKRDLLSSLKISRVLVRSSEPKLVWYEVWSHDLFGPGGCVKGYAYSNEKLSCVKSIDEAITGPCEPEQKELYRSIQGKWYLYYVSSN